MKKIVILTMVAFMFASFGLKAQKQDTIKLKVANMKILIVEDGENSIVTVDTDSVMTDDTVDVVYSKDIDIDIDDDVDEQEFEGHWSGFEFGFNGLVNENNEFPANDNWMSVNQARSWTFGLNMFQKDIPLIKENFGLVSGLGMKWVNYHFNNNINLEKDEGHVFGVPEEVREYTKDRLQGTYLTGVLAFELQFPVGSGDNELFIMAGGYGGYRMGSNYMQKWVENDNKEKNKTKDDYYLTDLEYGLTARIGVSDINLFANYSLTPLFKSNRAEAYNPVTVGIMLVGF